MADRTVSVKLVADAQAYIRGVDEAARKTRESSDQIEQKLAQQKEAYERVGVAALAVGTIAAAGVAAAVNAYSQFDAAMSNVQAATGESAANMQLLGDAALDAGARTVYSATEAAAAIEELSKAGVSTADILGGGLDGALDLAAAGQIDVAEAAETAASAMTQFGLEGQDVTHIADLLAAAAGNAQGGVSDMGAALSQSGLVASQMGLSIEETTGTLAAFASAGLLGSDAGTSFRAMLLRLANPTGEVRDIMDDLGLSFYDAQGQFIGMEGVASQLTTQMADLTQEQRNAALATIFGQDAIRAASILYEQGAQGIAEWTATVDDSGYAAEQAAARLDNLQGDLEALGGAFETLLINLGSSADGPLRLLTQSLDDIVSGLAEMPEPLQAATIGAAALVAAVGLGAGAFLTLVPQIAATKVALDTLSISAASARGALGTLATFLGNPFVVATAAAMAGLLLLNEAQQAANLSTSEWRAIMEEGATATRLFDAANREWIVGAEGLFGLANSSTFDFVDDMEDIPRILERSAAQSNNFWESFNAAENAGLNIGGFTTELGRIDDQLAQMDFDTIRNGFSSLVDEMGLNSEQAALLLTQMDSTRDALIAYAQQNDLAVTSTDGLIDEQALLAIALGETTPAADASAAAVEDVAAAYTTTAEAASELLDAQREIIDQFFAAQDAMIGYEQSLDDIQAALAEGLAPALDATGTNFDLSNESGRQAAQMLAGMVTSANEATDAMIANGSSAEEVAAFQARARDEIAGVANQMDATGAVAETYTGQLLDIPDAVTTAVDFQSANAMSLVDFYMAYLGRVPDGINTNVTVSTAQAQANVDGFINTNDGRRIRVNVETGQIGVGSAGALGVNIARASGGLIPGWSPGVDDRLGYAPGVGLIGLGGGEYIMPPHQSRQWHDVLEAMRAGTLQGFANGGQIGPSYSTSYQSWGGSTVVSNQNSFMVQVPVGEDVRLAARQVSREFANEVAGVSW